MDKSWRVEDLSSLLLLYSFLEAGLCHFKSSLLYILYELLPLLQPIQRLLLLAFYVALFSNGRRFKMLSLMKLNTSLGKTKPKLGGFYLKQKWYMWRQFLLVPKECLLFFFFLRNEMNVFATNELCFVRKKRLSGDCKLMRRSIRRKLEAPIEKKKKGQGGWLRLAQHGCCNVQNWSLLLNYLPLLPYKKSKVSTYFQLVFPFDIFSPQTETT